MNGTAPTPSTSVPPAATPTPVTIARGDGIGPEIMAATLQVLEAAGASLAIEEVEIGEQVYRRGVPTGIEATAWESLRRTRVFLKAPITTPRGGGYQSLNVTARKTLGLYANVRPCVSYDPFVHSAHTAMNLVIVRENEEDTYAGIEHQQTNEVVQCLKLISRPACERISRYAFEYARRNGRHKVTSFTKDNIMKLTDGMFRRVFEEVAGDYPDIEHESLIVDIGAAFLADSPERFDVLVMPNLYGDIMSDIAAQISGSVGLCGSANIGADCAMFEAIHGSAPDIAGRDLANPSGLLHGAILMLTHVGQTEAAERIHNAWLRAIEDGIHTADIWDQERSRSRVGTEAFALAVAARLGLEPRHLPPVHYSHRIEPPLATAIHATAKRRKDLVGVDVFLDWDEDDRRPASLGARVAAAVGDGDLKLAYIANRGVRVHPDGLPETFCTDHWRCRFRTADQRVIDHREVLALLHRLAEAGLDFVKTEHLYDFDGQRGYSSGQGE